MYPRKNIKVKKLFLDERYNEWQKTSWDAKEYKLKILDEIDGILDFIEKTDKVFVAQFNIRIAYSVPQVEHKIAEKYFLKIVKKENLFVKQNEILETAYQGLGDLYFEIKEYDKACDIYVKLLDVNEISEFLEEDILQISIAMLNHSKRVFHAKAEELLLNVYNMDICDEEIDHILATKANYNLGLVKYHLGKNKEAKPYLEKALILYKQRKWDCKNINSMLNNINEDSIPSSVPFKY